MTRWFRARRLLESSDERVLDLGSAFGFLTERLTDRWAAGIEMDSEHLKRAAGGKLRRYIRGAGEYLPVRDGAMDAVTFLDVLEHVASEQATIAEISRVLKPGGTLVLSVPGDGWLAGADSLNVYGRLAEQFGLFTGRLGSPIPRHRHYSLQRLRELLGPAFEIERIQQTGLGLAELVNLKLLILCLGLLRSRKLYDVLQNIYFAVYVMEDVLPLGPASYHLMIRARRTG